ncbi:MAG: sulfotransferase [Pseudomonadota bacterium]
MICGCPRSGTTALVDLLNCHPDIAASNERFARLIGPKKKITRAHFTTERYMDFQEGDCGEAAFSNAKSALGREKWADAKWVIDKMPSVYHCLSVAARLPFDAVVAIFRDPLSIAMSYEARLRNALAGKDSTWRHSNDYERAVQDFNRDIKILNEQSKLSDAERGYRLLVVEYTELYKSNGRHNEIYEFLGLDPSLAFGIENVLSHDNDERQRELVARRYVTDHANIGAYRELTGAQDWGQNAQKTVRSIVFQQIAQMVLGKSPNRKKLKPEEPPRGAL